MSNIDPNSFASKKDALTKSSLKLSEWLFLLTLLFSLASFLVIAKATSFRSAFPQAYPKEPILSVEVRGAVYKPGLFQVEKGTPLGEILRKSRPKPLADCSGFDRNQTIDQAMVLEVGEVKELMIEIVGCVIEPLTLALPPGTRMCDLKKILKLSDEADRAFFKSRKLLRNGDRISVPKRKHA